MIVPFLDLARLHASIRSELDDAFDRVLRTSAFVGGAVRDFEDEFASAHSRRAGAGCGSGTDALALALRALGIASGDEVVVPSMTFVATAEAVVHAGGVPVLADVDPVTLLVTEASVAAVRTERTKAVVPVHLYGHVVPFDLISRWRDDGLVVVEDAAQAHLASWESATVGASGHAACFSFYPGKNLGALGDGGMVISDDLALIDEVRRMRDHGRRDKYLHEDVGWCSRLDGIQAAFLSVKLRHLPGWTAARRAAAERYRAAIGEDLVPWTAGAVHHLLVARCGGARATVADHLEMSGISTGVHYPVPLSRQPAMRPFARATPVAEVAAEEILSLPLDPLMSDEEIDHVCVAWSARQ